jgi:hypothetical protein
VKQRGWEGRPCSDALATSFFRNFLKKNSLRRLKTRVRATKAIKGAKAEGLRKGKATAIMPRVIIMDRS